MITIAVVSKAKTEQEREEFFKSLSYSHSGEFPYEISDDVKPETQIHITLSDDCLVLNNSWDKYIKHALDNGLPQYGLGQHFVPNWRDYVQSKMGLQTRRPPEGIFPDLAVELTKSTT